MSKYKVRVTIQTEAFPEGVSRDLDSDHDALAHELAAQLLSSGLQALSYGSKDGLTVLTVSRVII